MTNLAAAVELDEAAKFLQEELDFCQHLKDVGAKACDTEYMGRKVQAFQTILAELCRGAGGDPVAYVRRESLDWLSMNPKGNILAFGTSNGEDVISLFTRSPVAGLAELTDAIGKLIQSWRNPPESLKLSNHRSYTVDAFSQAADELEKAARECLGKVDG